MKNKFAKHYEEYSDLYDQMIDLGKISQADVEAAGNLGGKYSYAEQDEANKRINEYIKTFVKKNQGNEDIEQLGKKFPVVEEFHPDPMKWRDYDQEQMGRLAESLHYNWQNKEDRSELMGKLQAETIRNDKKKIYSDYAKEHPIASWINENVFAPNSSEKMKRGDDITNKDVALDILNTGSFFTPGGVGKSAFTRGLTLGADIAGNAALSVAEDMNLDRELGFHNIVAPVLGAGLGKSVEAAPKLIKSGVDMVVNNTGLGKASKKIEDAMIESPVLNAITDNVDFAKNALKEEADAARHAFPSDDLQKYYRSNTKPETYEKFMKERAAEGKYVGTKADADAARLAKKKEQYSKNPEYFKKDVESGKISPTEAQTMLKDNRFKTVIDDYNKNLTKSASRKMAERVAKAQVQGAIKHTGRGAVIAKQNQARHKESDQERSDINWFKENYAKFWENNFTPHGNENEPVMKAYREWQEEQEKKKQKRPSIEEVL